MPYREAAMLDAAVVLAEYIEKLCSVNRYQEKEKEIDYFLLNENKYSSYIIAKKSFKFHHITLEKRYCLFRNIKE